MPSETTALLLALVRHARGIIRGRDPSSIEGHRKALLALCRRICAVEWRVNP